MTGRERTAVACVGLATLDLIHRIDQFPSKPLKIRATDFGMSVGGMAAGAACAIARLGGQAQFWGPVGDDTFGDTVRAELAGAGVDAGWVEPIAGAQSSHSAVIVDGRGERFIVNHRGSALASDAKILPLARFRAHAVLVDARWPAGAAAMLVHANALGLPTVLDADMGDTAALGELVPLARHVIFSEPGFAEWAEHDCDDVRTASRLRSLVADGAQLAAVTRGERSVLYATSEGVAELASFHVETRETLGAGDVFHGAYALAVAEKMPIVQALRFAAAAAAIKCMRSGGRAGMPARDEVMQFLAQRP